MRIIIEDSEPKAMAAAAGVGLTSTVMPGATMTPIDAGPPSATLMQAVSTAATANATDAGTPPEALTQALQSQNSVREGSTLFSATLNDAGGAPTA